MLVSCKMFFTSRYFEEESWIVIPVRMGDLLKKLPTVTSRYFVIQSSIPDATLTSQFSDLHLVNVFEKLTRKFGVFVSVDNKQF
jgi:hypothetical protein